MTIAEIDANGLIIALIPTILTGGAYALVKMIRNAGPEASAIAASSVIKVNEDMRKELDRNQETIDRQAAEIIRQAGDIGGLEKKIAELRSEVTELSASLEAARRP